MIIVVFLLWIAIKFEAPWWVYIPLVGYIIMWLINLGIKLKEVIDIFIFELKIKHLK